MHLKMTSFSCFWSYVLAPAVRRSLICGRGRSFGRCGAPSSHNFTRASRAHHESSRTYYVVAYHCRRVACGSLRARGGGVNRRSRARGAAIADLWPRFLVRSLWRALVTQLYARVTRTSRIIAHVLPRRSSLSSRGMRGFACARRGSRPSSSRPRCGDR